MKKILSFLIGAAALTSFAFAGPDSGEFWPSGEAFDSSNIYLEARGNFVGSIVDFDGSGNASGLGGGIGGGIGYNFGGWLFGLNYDHNFANDGLLISPHLNEIQLNVRRVLAQESISFLPEWLELVPGIGGGINLLSIDGDELSIAPFIKLSFEFAIRPGTERFIPYLGCDYDLLFSDRVNGVGGYPRVNLGFRLYPFGNKSAAAVKAAEAAAVATTLTPATGFTPDGDGINDEVKINTAVSNLKARPESWTVEVRDQQNEVIKSWSGKGKVPEITWDGTTDTGDKLFSSENYKIVTTVIPAEKDRIRLGQDQIIQTETVKTGVLMEEIIPQKQWKIVVNTIYFDSNAASFDDISDEQALANKYTLDSIAAQALALSDDILIEIQGYANNVSNTEQENHDELIPLSLDRAQAIKQELKKRGVKEANLTAVGKGGANPLAAWEDKAHWWKNRRVEFVVTRK